MCFSEIQKAFDKKQEEVNVDSCIEKEFLDIGNFNWQEIITPIKVPFIENC